MRDWSGLDFPVLGQGGGWTGENGRGELLSVQKQQTNFGVPVCPTTPPPHEGIHAAKQAPAEGPEQNARGPASNNKGKVPGRKEAWS